ncbi:MAG TPA: hypothetical protein VFP91_08725 [Vicinamibacterales bacterium]|nr:hypothetical protein [Vicinamibacterales bacterium]
MLLAAAAVAALSAGGSRSSDFQPDFETVLSRDLGFSAADLTDLARGTVAKHTLSPRAPEEVGVVGAIRIRGSRDRLIAAYRDIVAFRKTALPPAVAVGRFSDPPGPADLDALTTDDFDLRRCKVGDCDIRLPTIAIQRVATAVDWHQPDADARASAFFKQMLLTHVQSYETGAPGRITEYDDGRTPILPTLAAEDLIKNASYLDAFKPGLAAHMQCMWSNPLEGADDFLYWSKESFGPSPFVSVTHVTIAQAGPHHTVAANRDVYSSRFIDAGLSMMVASDAAGDPSSFYLLYVNRTRASALRGAMAALRRSIVERKAKGSLDSSLRDIKTRLETP